MADNFPERTRQLVEKGERVYATRHSTKGVIGPSYVDSELHGEWRSQVIAFLENTFGSGHSYVAEFRKATEKGYPSAVKAGIGILRAAAEDLERSGPTTVLSATNPPIDHVSRLCDRFDIVARQLRKRHSNRVSLVVEDEYDLQDLCHALLRVFFDDVRPEEHTPSYAGGSSRMDFLLKREQVVLEVKRMRLSLSTRDLGSQLIEDIARYKTHADCRHLVCFVYDPDGLLDNPRGLEADLSQSDSLPVTVLIRPS